MKKILYFEDDQFLASMFQVLLEKEGYKVKHYFNPLKKEAKLIKLVLEENPDLIIMDIIMPVMDGYSATRILKTSIETKGFPVFGISNMGMKENVEEAINCGMTDYLVTHQVTPSGLVACVRNFFADPAKYSPWYKKI